MLRNIAVHVDHRSTKMVRRTKSRRRYLEHLAQQGAALHALRGAADRKASLGVSVTGDRVDALSIVHQVNGPISERLEKGFGR